MILSTLGGSVGKCILHTLWECNWCSFLEDSLAVSVSSFRIYIYIYIGSVISKVSREIHMQILRGMAIDVHCCPVHKSKSLEISCISIKKGNI